MIESNECLARSKWLSHSESFRLDLIVLLSLSVVYYSHRTNISGMQRKWFIRKGMGLRVFSTERLASQGRRKGGLEYHEDYRTLRSRTRKIRLLASRFNFRPAITWKLNSLNYLLVACSFNEDLYENVSKPLTRDANVRKRFSFHLPSLL